MSLNSQPLLIFKGVDSKPLHGRYASQGESDGVPPSIHDGLDNSVVITFDDANRHLITLGSTGSRKTTSVQAPAIIRLIETGCSGIVYDVKGEYRHLADKYPEQVIVIGADDDATPYNLIHGMSDEQFVAFLNEFRPKTREPYWGAMGVQDAKFVRKTYQLMDEEPTLADIVDALKDPQAFVRVCDAFVKFKSSLPKNYMSLLKAIVSNRFSILAVGESTLLGFDAPGMEDVQKQYSWQTNGLVSALAPFSTDTCLREKFSPKREADDEEVGVAMPSMEDLLYRDRKVLLMDVPVDRFGQTAHVISKLLRIRMISAITGFRRHKQIGCGCSFYTFFAADEYQHLVNVDQGGANSGLYDDTTFFDRCRGYGHINLIATQSVSALQAKTSAAMAIDCLLQNIGTVIVFSSTDPATDRLLKGRVSAMDAEQVSSVVRSDLPAGHAYVLGRALKRHGGATLVSRIEASTIPGAPHMSQYFSGMPDPVQVPMFSDDPDFVRNQFHELHAKPPISGSHVMRRSFKDRVFNIIQDLEVSQALLCPSYPECDVVLMEDAQYCVRLQGYLQGSTTTLWQRALKLIITRQDADGWDCSIPIASVMPFVEEYMTSVDRRVRQNDSVKAGFLAEQCREQYTSLSEPVEIFLPDNQEESPVSRMLRLNTGGASLAFPREYWECICRCLGHLESQYSRVSLAKHAEKLNSGQKADPFDVFFTDE